MTRIEPTRRIALQFWWACLWRSAVILFALSFIVGFVIALVAVNLGVARESAEKLAAFLALAIGLTGSVEVTYRMLSKRFKGFELVLYEKDGR